MNVYVPSGIVEIVVVVPDPVFVTPPGVLITVQVPEDGNPERTTLPVETAHVGCVMVPITGGVGVGGWTFITTLPEEGDVQPASVVTAKV